MLEPDKYFMALCYLGSPKNQSLGVNLRLGAPRRRSAGLKKPAYPVSHLQFNILLFRDTISYSS